MAVFFYEVHDSRAAKHDDRNARSYTRQWHVRTNGEGPGEILLVAPVSIGDPYFFGSFFDSGSLCTKRDVAAANGDNYDFTFTAEYSTSTKDPEKQEPPLSRPTEISVSTKNEKRALDQAYFLDDSEVEDRPNDPIVNSFGDYFDPPIDRDDAQLVVTMVKNYATIDLSTLWSYVNTINDAAWLGAPAYSWRITDIKATKKFEDNTVYWSISTEFTFKPSVTLPGGLVQQGWNVRVVDRGYRYKQRKTDKKGSIINPPEWKVVQAKDDNGAQQQGLIPLNGNGEKLSQSAVDDRDFQYMPLTGQWRIYPTANFAGLGLP